MRLTKRQILPHSVTQGGLQNPILLGDTASASFSVAGGAQLAIVITQTPNYNYPLFGLTDISLYEDTETAANQIGVGSSVDESQWQVIGPFNDWGTTDDFNIKTNIYVRNTSGSTDFTKRVANTNDDGSKFGSSSWSTSELKVGDSATGDVDAAVRFNNVTIAQGATINSATLTLTSTALHSFTYLSKIYGIDEDDTADFSSSPLGRTKTTASVDWDETSMADEAEIVTPDIKTIVQEIVDRGSWASGNDMGFIIENDGTSGSSNADFYDYGTDSSKAALLSVNYNASSSKTLIIKARTRYIVQGEYTK